MVQMQMQDKVTNGRRDVPVVDGKRPPSALSTGSSDSGVFSAGNVPTSNSRHPTEPSSTVHTGPPSPTAQISTLLHQAANLMAVNEQLRKEIADSQNRQTMGVQRQMNMFPSPLMPVESPIGPVHPGRYLQTTRGNCGERERRAPKPESYKTVICQAWLESKTCSFAENCRFAHGEEELRPCKMEPRQNNKYKTKLCDKYTTTGLCPYGKRCLFIHPDNGPNAYIRADKLFEVSQRHALADFRDQMEAQIMHGGQNKPFQNQPTAQPPVMTARPSTPVEPATKIPIAPLGPTPVSVRGPRMAVLPNPADSARPHPSWPLEPSTFFADNGNNKMMRSRPASPFESLLMGAAAGLTMIGQSSTPGGVSGYVSGGSTPYDADSPFSPAALLQHPLATSMRAANVPRSNAFGCEEDSFSMVPGFEHLAEDLAKHLDLW